MQTTLSPAVLQTASGQAAERILRTCVHCGFCNATCPTYQLTGDELDGPRGRIYLIKQVLEGNAPTAKTRLHLDRCLTCRACETTCPSGVDYHRLLDTGRELTEHATRRPRHELALRFLLRKVLGSRALFMLLLRTGQWLRPLLPAALKSRIPQRKPLVSLLPDNTLNRKVLMLTGCVQPALAPEINRASERVLQALGIRVIRETRDGCCGALSHHLSAAEEARAQMRHNIDTWWPHIESGAEAIVVTASGCAPMVKEYGHMLADDPDYAARATRVSELAKDLGEVIAEQQPWTRLTQAAGSRIAFHAPCTLQHGQQLHGVVENILQRCGFQLTAVADAHLCCGSAGTYSILQPGLSNELRTRKLQALQSGHAQTIATANIGCLAHMSGQATVPVVHWIELLCSLLPKESA